MEDGNMRGAAPECAGLGWVYYNGHCYLFDRYRSINYKKVIDIGGLQIYIN